MKKIKAGDAQGNLLKFHEIIHAWFACQKKNAGKETLFKSEKILSIIVPPDQDSP